MFAEMMVQLEKAEKFIFMEYFIIEEGKFWNSILEILIDKAANGVDVRVMYDDLGSVNTLPRRYYKKLNKKVWFGLSCLVFIVTIIVFYTYGKYFIFL